MISVIIPLYNKEKSIKSTLQSVLMQTYKNYEIVVVDDGSTDDSFNIIREMQSPFIQVIKQKNKGVSAARNLGIKKAKYDWIAFLDADDLWEENHLQALDELISKYSDFLVFTSGFRHENQEKKISKSEEIISDYFLQAQKEKLINSSTCIINKSCFHKVGYFNENLKRGEDLEMWYRLAKEYVFIKNPSKTVVYRLEAENRAMNDNVAYEKSFASIINLRDTKSVQEILYLKYQIKAKYKSCLYNREWLNLWKCFLQHKLSFL